MQSRPRTSRILLIAALCVAIVAAWLVVAGAPLPVEAPPQQLPASTAATDPSAPKSADALRVLSREAGGPTWSLVARDKEGRPIAGAELRVRDGEVLARTDSHGEIGPMALLEQRLTLRRDGFLDCEVGPVSEGSRHEVCMTRAATLAWTVVDDRSLPVAGVRIEVQQQDGAESTKGIGVTDERGEAVLTSLVEGPIRLEVEATEVIVSRYDVPPVAPARGTIHVVRPVVAFGEFVETPESWQTRLAREIVRVGLAPQGPEQAGVAVFANRLREGRADRVAYALCCPLESIPAGAGLDVSYLVGGRWHVATIPFRRFESGMRPAALGERLPVVGRVVALEVRSPGGAAMPLEGLELRIAPQPPAPAAHDILVRAAPFAVRLPGGRYKLTSRAGAVALALPDDVLEVADRPANEPALPWTIQLARNIAAVDFEVPWTDGAAPLDAGSVFVRHESGKADVRYFPDGGLRRAGFLMAEGWNDVVLTDQNGATRNLRVQIRESGRLVVDGMGRGHAR
jgi:hypothetical protein